MSEVPLYQDIALRARMMHFIQSVQHYLVMDVIENSWHVFLENMRSVKTVEEVIYIFIYIYIYIYYIYIYMYVYIYINT